MWSTAAFLMQKKILLDKAMVHAVPKQVTTNPLMSTAHWLHSDRCTAQCTVCLQPCDASRQPQDYQAAKLIAPSVWLHKVYYSLKISALCPWTIYMFFTVNCQWRAFPEMTDFSTEERGAAQHPLSSSHVKQDIQWLTWKDMQKVTVTQQPLLTLQWP